MNLAQAAIALAKGVIANERPSGVCAACFTPSGAHTGECPWGRVAAMAHAIIAAAGAKEHVYAASLKFKFRGPVDDAALTEAILRSVNSKNFRLVGRCEVVHVGEIE